MNCYRWIGGLSLGFIFLTGSVLAKEEAVVQIQLPQCLAQKSHLASTLLAENKEFQIIELPLKQLKQLVLLADKVGCGRFLNVSHLLEKANLLERESIASNLLRQSLPTPLFPVLSYEIKHEEAVNAALEQVDSAKISSTLTHLTDFYTRYANAPQGKKAAEWLKQQFENMAKAYGREDTESYYVKAGQFIQPSVVNVIGKELEGPGIVIGAHIDTLEGRMPGADDDGSGTSTVMEIARVLLASKLKLKRPIYIIWYAAEEQGLVGSQYLTRAFQDNSIPVMASLQFDMTGFRNHPDDNTMWVVRDYTNQSLSNFLIDLIQTYIKVPVGNTACGYACSDHASWTLAGIPAAFPLETSFNAYNPYIHSSNDKMEYLFLEHMTNFTKLGLAFAIELASE